MATKITIDELVTKYVFEVDKSGQKAYDDAVKKGTEGVKAAGKEETKAREKTSDAATQLAEKTRKAQERAVEKGVRTTEAAVKRAERAQARASKRTERAVKRETRNVTAARARAVAAAIRGDSLGARVAIAQAKRAETARAAAVRRGARARQRAELRAQRRIRRAHRRTTRVIRGEARKQAAAQIKATKGAAGAERRSGRAENAKKLAGAFGDIGKAATVAAAGIAVATGAVLSFVDSQTIALDTIAKQSKQVGLGAEEFQRLSFAADRSGLDINGVGTASKKLQAQLQDAARGGGLGLVSALGEIGLAAEDIQGRTFEKQLGIISDAMNRTATDTEKVGISARIFGQRAGPDLIPLLNEGSKGLEALGAAAGDVFTAEELAPAEAFQDRMTDIKTEISQLVGRFASDLIPAVEETIVKFREWIKENEPLIREQAPKILAFFSAVSSVAFTVIGVLGDLALKTGELATALETLALAFVAVKLAMTGPAGMVIAAALAGVAIGNLLNAFGASDNLESFISDITGLNDQLAILSKQAGGEGKRGQGAQVSKERQAAKDQQKAAREAAGETVEFKQGGRSRFIRERTLFDIATGDIQNSELSQQEALNIVTQLDRQKDPDREARAAQRGKASAAKGARDAPKKKGGKKRAASGLEAQIEGQFKQAAGQTELRESARALQEGKGAEESFKIGREAAKQTEERLRRRFRETGETPEGITRDIQSLARSPAVEESIGRVPPPVISVVNKVSNITVSGNQFETQVDAQLTGVGTQELGQAVSRATLKMVHDDLGDAVRNLTPQTKV